MGIRQEVSYYMYVYMYICICIYVYLCRHAAQHGVEARPRQAQVWKV